MLKIPCVLYRGGTSKGPFFLESDLPEDIESRNRLLLRLMGSPHARQIDGIGGGDSLSSKVAIVRPSKKKDIDVDYLFCQVHIEKPIVETTLNCGNMVSAVAPFAIQKGLVKTSTPETVVRIYNINTGVVIHATVQTPGGILTYEGKTKIAGVLGESSPIKLSFLNAVGAKTGKLLPTGNIIDNIDGVTVSCVDVAVPMVIIHAHQMNKTGYESKQELDTDREFMRRLEFVRQTAALKMGLGNVSGSVSPKICIIAPPRNKTGTISSRYFTPFSCHAAHAVSGALCLASACLIKGTIAHQVAKIAPLNAVQSEYEIMIEHASGIISTSIVINTEKTRIDIPVASFIRTARPLFEGNVLIPASSGDCNHTSIQSKL